MKVRSTPRSLSSGAAAHASRYGWPLAFVSLMIGACADPPAPLDTADLLARVPDATVSRTGEIVPMVPGANVYEPRVQPETAVRYRFDAREPGRLDLEGTSEAPGTVRLVVQRIPSWNAAPEPADAPIEIDVPGGGRFSRLLPLPIVGDGWVDVEVRWSTSDEPLHLTRLDWRQSHVRWRPDIIFISIDTLSAGHLSIHGYERWTTPRLAELAGEAVMFEHCRSNAPRTQSSYVSQFTGQFVTANGEHKDVKNPEPKELPQNRAALAEVLRASGYRTAMWVGNATLARTIGIYQGFDFAEEFTNLDRASVEPPWNLGSMHAGSTKARKWLAQAPLDVPSFCIVQAMDVHGPYLPAAPWGGTFGEDELVDRERTEPTAGAVAGTFGTVPSYIARAFFPELPERVPTSKFVDAYDEEILELDQRLGEFLDHLKEDRRYDDAIIVVSADHGESMLAHDYFFGHGTLHTEALHVPLLVRLPGGAMGGTRIETPVQLVDLFPTLVELVGANASGIELHGRSLVPALEGEALEGAPLFAEGGHGAGAALELDGWRLIVNHMRRAYAAVQISHPRVRDELQAIAPELFDRDATAYRVREAIAANPAVEAILEERLGPPIYELYHVAEDPMELEDLASAEPERLARMTEILDGLLDRATRSREEAEFFAGDASLSDEALEELRALGYLGEDGGTE